VLGALLVFATGLALLALLSGYDLRHWDAVIAPSLARYTLDDHGVGIALAWYMTVVLALVSILTIAALFPLSVMLLRGSRTARAVTGVLTCSYLLCCGALLPGWRSLANDADASGNAIQPVHDRTMPVWVRAADASAVYLIFGGAILATLVLFLPAICRALQARRG
jgi:hypothetical protein